MSGTSPRIRHILQLYCDEGERTCALNSPNRLPKAITQRQCRRFRYGNSSAEDAPRNYLREIAKKNVDGITTEVEQDQRMNYNDIAEKARHLSPKSRKF